MDESLSHWLGLRESADAMARSDALTRTIAGAMPSSQQVCVLDLATGTGSNIRYLVDRLPGSQRWLAVDRDAALLADLGERMSSWGAARGYDVRTKPGSCVMRGPRLECEIETRRMDLGTLEDDEIFAGRHLVTASALLDLVSAQWLRALASRCRAAGASALFTLTYNGRSSCVPAEPEDDTVRDLMNQHQKRDKGLGGPAAGPDAVACAERCFAEAGYRVQLEPSDWTLGPDVAALQRMLIDGWAHAATEMLPDRAATIARWHARRLAHVDAARSRLVVGHDDLAAWLPRAPTYG
jgi:hypothetical protein